MRGTSGEGDVRLDNYLFSLVTPMSRTEVYVSCCLYTKIVCSVNLCNGLDAVNFIWLQITMKIGNDTKCAVRELSHNNHTGFNMN